MRSTKNPYHRYEAIGYYAAAVRQAQNSIHTALAGNSRNLSDRERAHLMDALSILEGALAFDKTNEAECKAAGV